MRRNCLAECAHLTITVSQTERDIGRKSSFFHTPLHSTPPLGGFRWISTIPFDMKITRMALLPDGEKISKISLFVLTQLTNVTDRWTDRHRAPAIAALMRSIARQKPLEMQTKKTWQVCSLDQNAGRLRRRMWYVTYVLRTYTPVYTCVLPYTLWRRGSHRTWLQFQFTNDKGLRIETEVVAYVKMTTQLKTQM